MKKFNRIFKRLLKQFKKLISADEYTRLLKYIIFLISKNKKIIVNKNRNSSPVIACKRGEIFLVNFGFGIGSEFRYTHYCVVITVDRNDVIVVPFTSKINNSNLDGIMLARGVIGNPWLIPQIKELMESGKIFTIPKFSEVKSTLLEHLELLSENKGAIIASMEINKFIKPYFKSFQSEELHEKLNKIIIEKNLKHKIDLISLL